MLFLSNSPLVKKRHLEHLYLIMSGAAPLAKSDMDPLYSKFNIDHNTLKCMQGKYSSREHNILNSQMNGRLSSLADRIFEESFGRCVLKRFEYIFLFNKSGNEKKEWADMSFVFINFESE